MARLGVPLGERVRKLRARWEIARPPRKRSILSANYNSMGLRDRLEKCLTAAQTKDLFLEAFLHYALSA